MRVFKQNEQLMGTAIQLGALSFVFLGIVIGHWLFGQLLIGLLAGFLLFIIFLFAHISGKVKP